MRSKTCFARMEAGGIHRYGLEEIQMGDIGSKLTDKFMRWIVFTGGAMFGAGMFVSGLARSVSVLVAGYGLLLGLGLSLVYGCTINNTIKFFPDRRGMAGGLTTAVYGISSVVIAPIATVLNDMVGVRWTFKILGIIFIVIICTCSFFLKKCPDGFMPKVFVERGTDQACRAMNETSKDHTPLEMMKAPVLCNAAVPYPVRNKARLVLLNDYTFLL